MPRLAAPVCILSSASAAHGISPTYSLSPDTLKAADHGLELPRAKEQHPALLAGDITSLAVAGPIYARVSS